MDQLDAAVNSEHEEARQLVGILFTLIWASWGLFLFAIIIAIYYSDWKSVAVTLVGCALLIVPLVFLRRRHLHASSLVFMLIMLGTVTSIATIGQGIRDLAIMSFPILFIFAGLTLERTYFRLCVGLALVAICWLVFGEALGWFTAQPLKGGLINWFYLVGVTLILLVAALAVDLLATNMRRKLEQARTEILLRKQMEQKLAQYSEHLEEMVEQRTRQLRDVHEQFVRQERLATLGQLAGSVAHELRNPLGVISNAIYFLKMSQPDADDKIKDYLNIIENETLGSDKIISDLLDFTRIKSVERKPVPVSKLIHETLERFPVPLSVEVALEFPADLPSVYADPQHIVQVIGNLIVNACQSMASGGKLTISAAAQSDVVTVAVKDTGVGIPPENIKKLFEPLFTTKTKGLGLGLPVSKKLAEANGGRIEVESEPGKGSTFTVYLPVSKETE